MKKRSILIYFSIVIWSLSFTSCKNDNQKNDKDSKVITERIQYDVFIKSPDTELEWYNQNLEGLKREDFVKTIINAAYEGKVKAYDYFNTLIPAAELKKTYNRVDTVSLQDISDPNIMHDTVIKTELDLQQITKVRFLEEWKMNPENLSITKNVIGIMLLRENYGDSLELRGYSPMFWIYFDEKYPDVLKAK